MSIYQAQHQRGVTLLELMLVLAVIAGLLFLSINRYQTQKRDVELRQTRQNIQYISHALNIYYRLNCKTTDAPSFTVNMRDLKDYLPPLVKSKLVKPWQNTGYDYFVTVSYVGQTKDTKEDIYQLIIKADLNVNPSAITWYRNKLGASSTAGTILTWISMPSYAQPTIDSSLWIMNAGLGFFKSTMLLEETKEKSCGF